MDQPVLPPLYGLSSYTAKLSMNMKESIKCKIKILFCLQSAMADLSINGVHIALGPFLVMPLIHQSSRLEGVIRIIQR